MDTRPPCPECKDDPVAKTACPHCYGSGREPQIVEAGPVQVRAEAYARPQ